MIRITVTKKLEKKGRPPFLDDLGSIYSVRHRNVILLTGDVEGIFWDRARECYVSLEELLVSELGDKFLMVRMNIGSGVTFFDPKSKEEAERISVAGEEIASGEETSKLRTRDKKHRSSMFDFDWEIRETLNQPLVALTVLRSLTETFSKARSEQELVVKPLAMVIQYAGSIFPSGDFSRMDMRDRQRIVSFMDWISSNSFMEGPDLIVLIAETKSEVSEKVLSRPNVAHLEIALPSKGEREHLINLFAGANPDLVFEGGEKGKEDFVENTAGLSLAETHDLLEIATSTKTSVTGKTVMDEVNRVMQSKLGDIIKINRPAHTTADIVGYEKNSEIFRKVFRRCDDPETAVSAILVSGPNGVGKTFQLEAHAAESGRIVIELGNIRGSYFGETDKFFEMLRFHIETYGRVLILVDEAHTAFGSVHSRDTHETEKRLAGNFLKMMGDPKFRGKVLWAMMTSRPDGLDPDVKSRSPIQIPIFDLEREAREKFVNEMFKRKGLVFSPEDFKTLLDQTSYYSARDYRDLVAEAKALSRELGRDPSVAEILGGWQASGAIREQREFQELLAVEHCSFPQLIPERLRNMSAEEKSRKLNELKYRLHI